MMRRAIVMVGVGLVLTGLIGASACSRPVSSASPASGGAVAWERDLGAALARAGAEQKLVMVEFYTDWCGWCRRLEETTYADGEVQRALGGLVSVKLNAEKGGRTEAAHFRVRSYPTIVFLDAGGKEVGRIPGYLPPRPFLEELRDITRRG